MTSDERTNELERIAAQRSASWEAPLQVEAPQEPLFRMIAMQDGRVDLEFNSEKDISPAEAIRIVLHALVAWSSARE